MSTLQVRYRSTLAVDVLPGYLIWTRHRCHYFLSTSECLVHLIMLCCGEAGELGPEPTRPTTLREDRIKVEMSLRRTVSREPSLIEAFNIRLSTHENFARSHTKAPPELSSTLASRCISEKSSFLVRNRLDHEREYHGTTLAHSAPPYPG